MRPSSRRLLFLMLAAASIPALIADRADAQDGPRLRLRPTFVAPEPIAAVAPKVAAPRATPFGAAPRTSRPPRAEDIRFGWDIEVHGGGSRVHAPDGTMTPPAAGGSFLTFNGLQTRAVRSWYFGDGAVMLNAHLASSGQAARITALDPVLNPSSVRTGGVGPFGVRVGRSLRSRLGVEFAFEMIGALAFTAEARDGAASTRSSFQSAFNARFAAFTGRSVTSDLTMTDGASSQILTTGALTINLRHGGRFVPYIVGGGGVLISPGEDPAITLAGDYQFVSGSNTPYRQTDTLNVRYASGTALAFLAGGGFKWYLTDRSGLRADFRAHFVLDPVEVVINWNPATIAGTPPNTIAFAGTPALQISTANPGLSSLSLKQAGADFPVATGGMREFANFTVGYFYRFPTAPPAPRQASAQVPRDRRSESGRAWELDGHGGGVLGGHLAGGTAISAFPVGESFTASSGLPSRYASTWMFGDGAVLINQIAAGFTGAFSARMSSLDPVLTGQSLERSRGGSGGARLSRRLTSGLRVEVAVETSAASLTFTQAAKDEIEATRASFGPVWNGLIATGGGFIFTNSTVSAAADLRLPTSWQTAVTGGIEYRLWDSARFETYATGAAGILRRSAALPEATLTGTYQFLILGAAPISERDVVRVHYSAKQNAPVGVFGGGMKYFVTPRYGFRADVRIQMNGNSMNTLVDATPLSTPGTPAFSITSTTNPALVFSNIPGVRGNLTGPAIADLKTFTGSGLEIQIGLTAGYFFRF